MGDPRNVAAWSGKTLDESKPQRVSYPSENDWDSIGCPLRCLGREYVRGEDEVHLVLGQLASSTEEGCYVASREAHTDGELLVLAIAQLQQTIAQANNLWRGSPRFRQSADANRSSEVGCTGEAGEEAVAR